MATGCLAVPGPGYDYGGPGIVLPAGAARGGCARPRVSTWGLGHWGHRRWGHYYSGLFSNPEGLCPLPKLSPDDAPSQALRILVASNVISA